MKYGKLKNKGISFVITALMAAGTICSPAIAGEETADEELAEELLVEDEDLLIEEITEDESEAGSSQAVTTLPQIDMTKWLYNSEDDVYYQLGIEYCSEPADLTYETLAIFVPGAFLSGTSNGDETFTCTLNTENSVGDYTALTAPIVIPVNTPGYSAMAALTEYTSFTEYTSQGFVYVHAGCRGRDAGAPAGVTDLKAAIRYLRYNSGVIPGDTESVFSFGMSGGGAQSAVLGATGNSDLYEPYLEAIGAVSGVSDAVKGSMCWCPITNLDQADEAYEWNLGAARSGLSEDMQALSDGLAEAYAEYINSAGITDEEGNVLLLEASEEGIYQAGSYYDYIKGVIEDSLNNFLEDTEFPYDASASSQNDMFGGRGGMGGMRGGMGGMHGGPDGMRGGMDRDFEGEMPEDFEGEIPEGFEGDMSGNTDADTSSMQEQDFEAVDDINRNSASSSLDLSGTYETPQDYIDALNANGTWVIYDEETGTVSITSVEDFVRALKPASKDVGAFDDLNGSQGENTLFGYGDGEGAHFDMVEAGLLTGTEYEEAFNEDLSKEDAVGNTVDVRLNMYTPLYYLLESYEGYGTSDVAEYWRIRTGIEQGDTALSTEVNLALALEAYDEVESVDFETVWGKGHTMAERTGDSTENFINWVNECM